MVEAQGLPVISRAHVKPDELAAYTPSDAPIRWRGCTHMPHKGAVMDLVDDPAISRHIGRDEQIVRQRVVADRHNTDAAGFLHRSPSSISKAPGAVVGAVAQRARSCSRLRAECGPSRS